jgi:hypothetical protein
VIEAPPDHEHEWSVRRDAECCTVQGCQKVRITARARTYHGHGYESEKVVSVVLDGEES